MASKISKLRSEMKKNRDSKTKDKIKETVKKKKVEEKPRVKLKTSGTTKELKVRSGKGYGL